MDGGCCKPHVGKGQASTSHCFYTAGLTVNCCCFGRFHGLKCFRYCPVGRKRWNNLVVNEGEWLGGLLGGWRELNDQHLLLVVSLVQLQETPFL